MKISIPKHNWKTNALPRCPGCGVACASIEDLKIHARFCPDVSDTRIRHAIKNQYLPEKP